MKWGADEAVSAQQTTRERILKASRELFNENGYAGTTISDIASAVNIAEGNLWYHFRTKLDLAIALEDEIRTEVRALIEAYPSGAPVEWDYVRAITESMQTQWKYRFLLRDQLQFRADGRVVRLDPDMVQHFDGIRNLLDSIQQAEMFRRDPPLDVPLLARSLWIVSRYWGDYLREQEGVEGMDQKEEERGIRQHFSILLPHLTASSRRKFIRALEDVTGFVMS